jgi:uncharacterized protein YsxB (DUF464 family)
MKKVIKSIRDIEESGDFFILLLTKMIEKMSEEERKIFFKYFTEALEDILKEFNNYIKEEIK